MDTTRTPYSGHSRKLVVALDIGTTFSGAAYAFLDPGEIPQIQPVTKYLNNPNPGSAKVSSIMYYDHSGNFRGVENGVGFQDGDEFLQMKWWKLMLAPNGPPVAMKDQMSKRLPKGKTVVDVFADFMGYLFDSTKALFKSSEPNGELRWDSISDSIELVLTHPNGWAGPQQAQLRNAAAKAGIVPDTPVGHASVYFVTEGEASFSFCATKTQAGKNLKSGEQVLIVDAGGGTIDISAYTVLSNGPLKVEELYEPKCLVQGGELVTARATAMVQDKLKYSKFDTPEDLAAFSQKFDEGVKKVFSSSNALTDQFVKFGSPRDNDPNCGIKSGRLSLTGAQVSGFFEPSIQSTVDTIRGNFRRRLPISSFAFLVGGFATSPWLSEQLEKRLSDLEFQFCRPNEHTGKAVVIGAVSYYIDHFVTSRITRFTIGAPCHMPYKPDDPEHVRRSHRTFIDPMGSKRVQGYFQTILTRGTKVLEDHEIRQDFHVTNEGSPPQSASPTITKYTGALVAPEWQDAEPDKFETLCYIKANISSAPLTTNRIAPGRMGYKRQYDIVLLVGLTELKAQLSWIDSRTGKEKRSDAVIVYGNPSEWT